MLQEKFSVLVKKYSNEVVLNAELWRQIEEAYSGKERQFHNLSHLQQMMEALSAVPSQIEDEDSLLFALFYHDLAYDVVAYVTDNNNEERSAEAAEKALQSIGYPSEKIERVKNLILATKGHDLSTDSDTNFFTDADLSILGQPWEIYKSYMAAIRREFDVYPDSIYRKGRSRVLKNFLHAERLFKTDHFHNFYQATAKENLERELEILSF